MPAGEIVERIAENPYRIFYGRSPFLVLQLEEKALPEVPCAHTGRFELLHHGEHALHLGRVGRHPLPERHVVHKGLDVAAKVAVVVEAADYEGGDRPFMIRQVTEAELLLEALGEALVDGECIVLRAFVLAPVADAAVIVRCGVVVRIGRIGVLGAASTRLLFFHLGDGDISRRVVSALGGVVDDGVVVELLPHALLKLLDRKLDELDGLDLERREPLGLLLF